MRVSRRWGDGDWGFMRRLQGNDNLYRMLLADGVLVAVCFYVAYLFRFEFIIPERELETFVRTLPFVVAVKMAVFSLFHLYRGMWRYTSLIDLIVIAKAVAVSSVALVLGVLLLHRFQGYPRSIFFIDGILTFLAIGGIRMGIRLYFARESGSVAFTELRSRTLEDGTKRVLIYGGGDAGEKALREIKDNPRLRYHVVAFIDDDSSKIGRTIHGVPVVDNVKGLKKTVGNLKVEEVIIAIPSAGTRMREIVDACKGCGVPFKTLPGMGELIEGKVNVKALRDVDYQDLLGRDVVETDTEQVRDCIKNKVIVVFGGAGSIGSELVRRLVPYNASNIIIFDIDTNQLHDIMVELASVAGYQRFTQIRGDILDEAVIDKLFARYRPHVVFHAAACKHVGMMEPAPWELVKTNIRGSGLLMEKAIRYGTERFVLVSTDKAVRPTNAMGASKRVAELILQSHFGTDTVMMAVRFGNVVGSSGSVVPLFRKQIALGGPVTVSHPEVTRYFMTIPEACQLILQAGALGTGGEIFILEMGTPVRIMDMARDLIRLSGKEPDRDIEIVLKGLEPGEKLYEELITQGEGIVPSAHDKIMVLRADGLWAGYGDQEGFRRWLTDGLTELYRLADAVDGPGVRKKLKELVPEYEPSDSPFVL